MCELESMHHVVRLRSLAHWLELGMERGGVELAIPDPP